jgi:putative ABC transport system ATP-binding protein
MDSLDSALGAALEVLGRLGAPEVPHPSVRTLVGASLSGEGNRGPPPLARLLRLVASEADADLWRLRLTPSELPSALRRLDPLVTILPDDAGFAVVAAAFPGRVAVTLCRPGLPTETRRLRPGALAQLLGLPDPEVAVDWLTRRAALPLEALVTPPGEAALPPWTRLIRLLSLEGRDLRAVFVYALGTSLLSLAVPLTVQLLISQALAGVMWQPAIILTLILVMTLGFRAFLEACEALVLEAVSRRTFVRLARDFAGRLVRIGGERTTLHPRLVAHRLFDAAAIEKGLSTIIYDGLSGALIILATVTLLSSYHALFAAAAFVVVILAGLLTFLPAKKATSWAVAESKAKHTLAVRLDALGAEAQHAMVGLEVEHALADVEAVLGKWSKAREKRYRVYFAQFVGVAIIQVVASTLLLAIGGWLVYSGELTVGQLVAGELMMTAALAGVSSFGKLLPKVYALLASVGKAGEVIDLPRHRELGASLPEGALTLAIGEPGREVVVAAGARVRIDAPSDTWERLLTALGGVRGLPVRLGGAAGADGPPVLVPATSCSREALGARIMVLDALVFIPATVAANLRLSAPELSDDAVWRLLEAVGLSRRGIRADTELGVDGTGLDRLARAQLAAARVLAGRPGLVVVDGLLDRLSGVERAALMELLTSGVDAGGGPAWTLLIRSADRAISPQAPTVLRVRDGTEQDLWELDGPLASAPVAATASARTRTPPSGGAS